MLDLVKDYSDENPNRFNQEIIYGLRDKDNIYEYLEDTNKALETIKNIKYIGMEIEEDENKFNLPRKNLEIYDSRLNLVTFKFEITLGEEKEEAEIKLFVPKRIDNFFYQLNGNKYYSIYQIVDESSYNTNDSVIIKSLLMPIVCRREIKDYVSLGGASFKANLFQINLFNHKINFLYYFLAHLGGINEVLKFFGVKKYISFVNAGKKDTDIHYYFEISKTVSLRVNKEKLDKSKYLRSFIIAMIDIFKKKNSSLIKKRNNKEMWMLKLGTLFTTTNQIEKAEGVLISFERLLDNRTKKILRIPEKDTQSIYTLIKWMIKNFDLLKDRDNLSLDNKRLRINEYIISSYLRRMSVNTYRILNTKTKLTMPRLRSLFKISPMFLVKKLITSELLRYNNSVNDLDLFNALKYSHRGPSAIGNGGSTVPIVYRAIHPSHVGRKSLNSCSNSDPGLVR